MYHQNLQNGTEKMSIYNVSNLKTLIFPEIFHKREWSLRIQQTGAEGIMLGHEIFCHENAGVWNFFEEFVGA